VVSEELATEGIDEPAAESRLGTNIRILVLAKNK